MKALKRTTESNPSVGDAVLSELDARLGRLEDRRKVVIAEIIALEKRLKFFGTINLDAPAEPSVSDLAHRLLGGDIIPPAPGAPDDRRLVQLYKERAVIDRALELGRSHSNRLRIAASAEVLAKGDERWQQNIRETALLAARLRRLGMDRHRLRDEIVRSVGGSATLPFEFFQMGRGPTIGDEFLRFLDAAKKAGVITQDEIKNA